MSTPANIPPWLVWYLTELTTNPLRTKSVTSGCLSGLQELTAQKLSGVKKFDKRIFQMAAYGKQTPRLQQPPAGMDSLGRWD